MTADAGTRTFKMGFLYPPGAVETLQAVLDRTRFHDWEFSIRASGGGADAVRMLMIRVSTMNSLDPDGDRALVDHHLPIPPVPYTWEEWERWVLDMIVLVLTHEAMEFYTVGDRRPFYPQHGPLAQPYTIIRTDRPVP